MTDSAPRTAWTEVDAFDLPEWLGVEEVTWSAAGPLAAGVLPGVLRSDSSVAEIACDLLAADVAHPAPVVDERTRVRVHEAWRRGQLHLVTHGARLTLAAPGTDFTAPRVLDTVGRLAKAVGAPPDHFSVRLRVARHGGGWDRGG